MLTKIFVLKIEEIYHKHFPNSKVFVNVSSKFYRNIFITPCLASNKEELSGGYFENDMFNIRFEIDLNGKQLPEGYEIELPDVMTLSCDKKSYFLKPSSTYVAYDSENLSFRKTTGDVDKILLTFERFIIKLKESLIENLESDRIHPKFEGLLKEKLGFQS